MTKSSPTKNSFSDYQEKLVKSRVSLIARHLGVLKKTKVEVKRISHLAALLATHLSNVQNSPCSASTLLRNQDYKVLLSRFMGERGGIAKQKNFDRLEALPLHLRIELSNLRSEVDRLKKYIGKLETEVGNVDGYKGQALLADPAEAERESQTNKLELAFAQSCQIVRTLLNYWKDYMGVDISRGEIIDLSFRRSDPRSAIVEAQAAKEFFAWLNKSELN